MARSDVPDYLHDETHITGGPSRDHGRCVLVFPNSYETGMSSLSVQTLYSSLNARGVTCERCFRPPERPFSTVRSFETGTLLGGFDFVLVTSSFELDWLNLPAMLEAGGVPPLRADRTEVHPMVIAGGPAVTCNPEPLADLVDACWLGEVEPMLDPLATLLRDAESREEVEEGLRALSVPGDGSAGRAGVYLPHLPEHAPDLAGERTRVRRLFAEHVSAFSTESAIITPHTIFGDRFLIEISRGCQRTCKFCLARGLYRPFRAREPGMLLERIDQALPHTDRVGLVGTAVSDYPWASELFDGLLEREANVSVSSVRAESVTEDLLQALGRSGQEMLTLAPEAGTDELRRQIGKPMTEEDLRRALELALGAGLTRFKLYFIAGLPGETEEDALGIAEMVARLREDVPEAYLSVSVSPFVPKPHTPFEANAVLPQAQMRKRLNDIKRLLQQSGTHDVSVSSARWAAAQTIISRGGRELGAALVTASLAGGAFSDLRSAIKRRGLKWQDYLGEQAYAEGTAPWDIVDC